ncbi:hypothetical protein, partial [Brucella sp. 09RB8918]|uniref:hypothetical protein n=1 Tax=Brucella sp. 09RB8918 TaxID=1844048 RepID=UPI0019D615A4
DYNVIINYEQTSYDKLATPSFVGRAHLNHIYLGGFFTTKIYLINIRVVNPSSTETEKKAINNIKERIKSLVEKSKRLKAIIDISPSNPEKSRKKYNNYLGDYVLKSRESLQYNC